MFAFDLKKTPDRLAGAFPFHVALEMDMYSGKPLPVAAGSIEIS